MLRGAGAAGKLDADALIFVNSIASVSLSDEDWASYCEAHSAILPKLVVEITEEEEMNERELERKRNVPVCPASLRWMTTAAATAMATAC